MENRESCNKALLMKFADELKLNIENNFYKNNGYKN